ncbi:hypothetical protein V500_04338 [Pseudogymnoascus sp. VKM F-4518 (FW-2643)]|nr:hypothetical protein V500_04338 [Pseudogymnoascus sp. VKM F-4518 (FW-2643)]
MPIANDQTTPEELVGANLQLNGWLLVEESNGLKRPPSNMRTGDWSEKIKSLMESMPPLYPLHRSHVAELGKDLEALNGQCELHEADIASLRHGKRDLQDRVSGLDEELQANMILVDTLQAKVDEQADTMAAYETQKGVVRGLQDEKSTLQIALYHLSPQHSCPRSFLSPQLLVTAASCQRSFFSRSILATALHLTPQVDVGIFL